MNYKKKMLFLEIVMILNYCARCGMGGEHSRIVINLTCISASNSLAQTFLCPAQFILNPEQTIICPIIEDFGNKEGPLLNGSQPRNLLILLDQVLRSDT